MATGKGDARVKPLLSVHLLVVLFLFGGLSACGPSPWAVDMAESHLKLGIAQIQAEQYNNALKELMKAEELTPDNARIHYFLGIAYHSKALRKQSVSEFERAIALKPDYSDAYNFLGTIYLNEGLWDRAIAMFEKALANILYDTPAAALYNMGWAYHQKGDYRTALLKYREAKIRDPNTVLMPLIEMNMGRAAFELGEYAEAVVHLKKSVELAPAMAEPYYWLGRCYVKMGRKEPAIAAYAEAVKRAPASESGTMAREHLDALQAGRP